MKGGTAKNDFLKIRIDTHIKELFAAYCYKIGSTPSDELRRYITEVLKK